MKTLIPLDTAADIVAFRLSQAADPELPTVPTLDEFADKLLELGYTSSRVSRETLRRLFAGKMYPALQNPDTGKPFDWKSMPGAPRGRRNKSTRLADLEAKFEALSLRVIALERAVVGKSLA